MNAFSKPHVAGFAAKLSNKKRRAPRRVHPYPRKLFETRDVFPLFILDGGAFFFSHDHLGGGSGADFIAALENGTLLAPWTVRKKVQWDKAHDDTIGSPCRTSHEKHVWLNRLYFLLPLAQRFLRTRDEAWATLWLQHFTDWAKAHPHPEVPVGDKDAGAVDPRRHAKHCWRDMQVTWRLLVLIHSVYLLERSRSLKKAQWEAVYDAIHQHAHHVLVEASRDLATGRGRGNHFLQKGVALLYAGILFPEFPEAEDFVACGRAVLEHQMAAEILPDGGNVEASPSYSHFIARLYLDAYLLLSKNKQAPIKGLKTCIQKQYRLLDETASPDGLTLQLSDSYALDADADLALAAKLLPFGRAKRSASICFKDSCFAVLRTRRAQVYVDGMALGLWHHHRGKPNVLIFTDGQPLVIDSGCCNYDLELREGWLKTAGAHNVVLVAPDRDERELLRERDIPVIRVAGFEKTRSRAAVMMVHEFASDALKYEWTRTVLTRADTIEIIDQVTASAPVHARQVFHLAPLNVGLSGDRRQATIERDGGDVILRQAGATGQGSFELTWRPAVGPDNRIGYSPEVTSRAYGREVQFHVRFALP